MNERRGGIEVGVLWIALGVAALGGVGASPPAARAQEELFVTNPNNNSVTVYARTATGNTAPLRTFSGPATLLSDPEGLAVDTAHNELVVSNEGNDSVTVYARTASGNTAPLRSLIGPATGLFESIGLVVDAVNNELVVANAHVDANDVTVYSRTASGNSPLIRTINGSATGLSVPQFIDVTTAAPPRAEVGLNGSVFHTGQAITYRGVLTPGSSPAQVDIYLWCLLPDGVTKLSLVQTSPGVISTVLGPSLVPFLTNQTLAPLAVPFNFTFAGAEPAGTYLTSALLAVAGSNPLLPANQLSLGVQPFQFSP